MLESIIYGVVCAAIGAGFGFQFGFNLCKSRMIRMIEEENKR
jgi:hypothetical protein